MRGLLQVLASYRGAVRGVFIVGGSVQGHWYKYTSLQPHPDTHTTPALKKAQLKSGARAAQAKHSIPDSRRHSEKHFPHFTAPNCTQYQPALLCTPIQPIQPIQLTCAHALTAHLPLTSDCAIAAHAIQHCAASQLPHSYNQPFGKRAIPTSQFPQHTRWARTCKWRRVSVGLQGRLAEIFCEVELILL